MSEDRSNVGSMNFDEMLEIFTPKMTDREKTRLASIYDALRARGWEPGQLTGWNRNPADLDQNYGLIARCRMKWDNLLLACVVVEILACNEPDTVRGVMYSVVSAGWLPDTSEKSYNRIQRLLRRLREDDGIVPFEWIVDNIRQTIKPPSWSGLDDFADTVRDAYRKDFWASLPEYVEVIVEKDTVAGRIAPVTREFDVALHPLRGYSSSTFAYLIAQHWNRIEKPIICYYIGDHDPSGRDLERDIQMKLRRYTQRDFEWQRLAVTPDDFAEFDILPLKVKTSDTRARQFMDEFGTHCAEVEAIPANDLRERVREAIETHIPQREWSRLKEIEKQERASWNDMLDQMSNTAA